MNLIYIVNKVTPSYNEVKREVDVLKLSQPWLTPERLSMLYAKKIRNKYASVGVVTSLPGVIPGLGTAVQVVVETGSVSADLVLMLRWMASLCYGTAYIYGRDLQKDFETEFTTVLGLWSGELTQEEVKNTKTSLLSVKHFDKHMAERIKNRMNQKVGRKLVAKYGSKRAGSALGKFIPFGIGAVVGGTFNYNTMHKFGRTANDYFKEAPTLPISQL